MRCLCVSFFVPDISFRIGGVLTDTFCLPRLHPFRMKSRPERRWRERTTRQHAVWSQNTVKRTRIHARTTGRQPTTSPAVLRLPLSPLSPHSPASHSGIHSTSRFEYGASRLGAKRSLPVGSFVPNPQGVQPVSTERRLLRPQTVIPVEIKV